MVLNLIGLACKVPLTILFLNGGYGVPAMGAVGCGIATTIVSWITCVGAWLLIARVPVYRRYQVFARWSWPDRRAIMQLLKVGLPIGATFFVDVTAFTFMTLFIARLGAATSGAHQIAANFAALLFMLPLALGSATGVLVGQAIGAGDGPRARSIGMFGIALSAAMGLALAIGLYCLRESVASLYTRDAAVAAIAAGLLAWVALYHLVDAIQAVTVNALRGYKRTVVPMVVATVALWGVGLGGGYWLGLAQSAPLGASGFWIAAIVSVTIAAALLGAYFAAISRPARLQDAPLSPSAAA